MTECGATVNTAHLPAAELEVKSEKLRTIAIEAAHTVAPGILAAFRTDISSMEKRNNHDIVTSVDVNTEKRLVELLTEHYTPGAYFLGEEGGYRKHKDSGYGTDSGCRANSQANAPNISGLQWIVDPIDGTSNFVHGFDMFSTSIAAELNGHIVAGAVHAPALGMTFSANTRGAWLQYAGEEPIRLGTRTSAASAQLPGNIAQAEPESERPESALNLVTSIPLPEYLNQECLEAYKIFVSTYATVRRVVSGALELCYTAAGWADISAGIFVYPWDIAAGQYIVRQAGGTYFSYGERPEYQGIQPARSVTHYAPHFLSFAPGVSSPTARDTMTRLVLPSLIAKD